MRKLLGGLFMVISAVGSLNGSDVVESHVTINIVTSSDLKITGSVTPLTVQLLTDGNFLDLEGHLPLKSSDIAKAVCSSKSTGRRILIVQPVDVKQTDTTTLLKSLESLRGAFPKGELVSIYVVYKKLAAKEK